MLKKPTTAETLRRFEWLICEGHTVAAAQLAKRLSESQDVEMLAGLVRAFADSTVSPPKVKKRGRPVQPKVEASHKIVKGKLHVTVSVPPMTEEQAIKHHEDRMKSHKILKEEGVAKRDLAARNTGMSRATAYRKKSQ